MKILFITGIYPKESEAFFSSKCKGVGLENAANSFQWRIIEGLSSCHVDFEVISLPFLPGYPMRNKMLFSPRMNIMYRDRKIGQTERFNTFFLFKDLSKRIRIRKYVDKWLKCHYCHERDKIVLMTYTPASCFLYGIIPLKRKYPGIEICSIIPDLVDDATNPIFKLSLPKYIQAKIEQKKVWNSYQYIDKYILLAKAMEEKIPQAINKNIVIEGIAEKVDDATVQIKEGIIKSILYTGSLQEFTGIMDFIKAFKKTTNKNYRLIICGSGPCSAEIEQESKLDTRIIFNGIVSRDEAIRLQRSATLLINPRKPSVDLTKYSFPSKTMEYLSSGTPMLAYHLSGIPDEYYPFFFTPKDTTEASLIETIEMIMKLSPLEMKERGEAAKHFVKSKESDKQALKILNFLSK